MLTFNWDPNLELGLEQIDRQHKNILKKANTFFMSYENGNHIDSVKECLDFLHQYIIYHFQTEEAFQLETGYLGYVNHCTKHEFLKIQFKFHKTELELANYSKEQASIFLTFLKDWIINHIMDSDMDFAQHYREIMTKRESQKI